MLERKANAVQKETIWAVWLHNQLNQSTHVTDSVTERSLSASRLLQINVATDRLCQIALNQKLLRKFKKWCKFSSYVKTKSHKKKSRKTKTCLQVNYVASKAFKMSVDQKIVFRLLIPWTKILNDLAEGMQKKTTSHLPHYFGVYLDVVHKLWWWKQHIPPKCQ